MPKTKRTSQSNQPAREKTTITLPVDLKRQAQHLAVEMQRDLSDLIAEGLRLVLARKGGK